jgi:hypothetical protein
MKKTILSLFSIFILFFFCAQKIFAQQSLPLAVYPAKQDVKVQNGEFVRAQIQFRNQSEKPVYGTIKVADFIINDKDGTPQLIEKSPAPKYGAANWITLPYSEITIPPNDFVSIDMSINVPLDVTTCGNYALVYFEPNLNASGVKSNAGGSAISTKIGGIINLENSNNNCIESASISDISYNNFQEYGPIKVSYDVANAGNIHLLPSGLIQLADFFGNTVEQKKIKEDRIFPETIRTYDSELGSKWLFGKYKIALRANYGSGKALNSSIFVWIFPWRLTIVVILALIIIFFLLKEIYKKVIERENKLEARVEEEKKEIDILKEKLKNRRE